MNLQKAKSSFFTSLSDWSSYIILVFTFLAPFFFIPDTSINDGKAFFVVLTSLTAFILFLASIIVKGRFSVIKSFLIMALAALPFVALFATFFSDSFLWSLLGSRFEVDTFAFIFSIAALGVLASAVFNSMSKIRTLFHYLLFSSIVLFSLQLVFLLSGQSVNLVGRLSDMGIFFGLITLISLAFLSFRRNLPFKWLYITALILSFLGVLVSGFQLVIIVLGVLSLIFFLYLVSSSYTTGRNVAVLAPSFFVFIISFLFFLGGPGVFNYLSESAGMSEVELRPTMESTIDVGIATLGQNPVFGSGPSSFTWQWQQYKPDEIVLSDFWHIDFSSGSGFIPTLLTTQGLLGFLLWITIPAIILYLGFRYALSSGISGDFDSDEPQKRGYFLSSIAFIATLYMWFFVFVHSPGALTLSLTFLLTGVFAATLAQLRVFDRAYVDFYQQNQKSILIHTVAVLLLIIVSTLLVYSYSSKIYSTYMHNQGMVAFQIQGDFEKAEAKMLSAANASSSDFIHRQLAELYLSELNQELVSEDFDQNDQAAMNRLQNLTDLALLNARRSVEINSSNYVNWLAFGDTYHNLASLQVQGSAEMAQQAYEQALQLSPKNPSTYLNLANLALLQEEAEEARSYIDQALEIKPNYNDAIFLRSTIDFRSGQQDLAISQLEELAGTSPFDVNVFFELGILNYINRDYQNAASAFQRVLALNPNNLSAKIHLGLSYGHAGEVEQAVSEFQELSQVLPENEGIESILNSLLSGQGLGMPEPEIDSL